MRTVETCPACKCTLPFYMFGSRARACYECFRHPPAVPRDVPPREAKPATQVAPLPAAAPGVLTRCQATAYTLRRAGLSVPAIARRLDVRARAVEKLLARARERLEENGRGRSGSAGSDTHAQEAA